MTALEHNKYVGLSHLGYAGLHLLTLVGSMALFGVMLSNIYEKAAALGGKSPPPVLISVVLIFGTLVNVVLTIPSVVAAYAFLKRRPWAKIAGIVAGATAGIHFPFGTAVAVYTFWFLFSDAGKSIYDRPAPLPPNPPSEWMSREPLRFDRG